MCEQLRNGQAPLEGASHLCKRASRVTSSWPASPSPESEVDGTKHSYVHTLVRTYARTYVCPTNKAAWPPGTH